MDSDLISQALAASKGKQRYAFATVIEATLKGTPQKSGAKMLVLEDGTIYGTIGGGRYEKDAQKECLKAIKNGRPSSKTYDYFGHIGQSICGGQIKVFFEPVAVKKEFVLCGGGHIGLALSMLVKMLNFNLTVIDSRRSFANKKRFAHADRVLAGPYAKQLRKVKIDENTYIMIVTQGNEFDYECLKSVLKSSASYIGVISSRAKKVKFFKRLKKEGATQKILNRIKIPAGFDIGAQSPAEIAVSIASEIIRQSNQRFLNTVKFKDK